ncbi:MAG: hypothetical protein V3R64_05200 [Sphingomonadales bacterium]
MHQFHWYNSKYTFVDQETGFLVVEVAESRKKSSFNYHITAIDCDNRIAYPLTGMHQDRNYSFFSYWKTNPTLAIEIERGSFTDFVGKKLCPDRYKLPRGIIPK